MAEFSDRLSAAKAEKEAYERRLAERISQGGTPESHSGREDARREREMLRAMPERQNALLEALEIRDTLITFASVLGVPKRKVKYVHTDSGTVKRNVVDTQISDDAIPGDTYYITGRVLERGYKLDYMYRDQCTYTHLQEFFLGFIYNNGESLALRQSSYARPNDRLFPQWEPFPLSFDYDRSTVKSQRFEIPNINDIAAINRTKTGIQSALETTIRNIS